LPPISRAEAAELDRRIAEHDSGKVAAIPWPTAKRQILRSLKTRMARKR